MADYKILLIDYEPRSIERLQTPLEKAGYSVRVAKDGLAGILAFNELKPHLTMIEAMLPKKHGFEVCQELKKTPHGMTTPIVILTSVYKGRKYRTQALHNYGCDEYLEKPLDDEKLLETVARLLKIPLKTAETAPTQAATKPAPAPQRPSAAPAPPAAARPSAPPVGDITELEIMERLDAILPDDSSLRGTSPASPTPAGGWQTDRKDKKIPRGSTEDTVPEHRSHDGDEYDEEKVVSFDPERSRKRRSDRATITASGPSSSVRGSSAHGAAKPKPLLAPEVSREPAAGLAAETVTAAQPEAHSRHEASPLDDSPSRSRLGPWIWLWVALVVLAVGAAAFLLFLKPSLS